MNKETEIQEGIRGTYLLLLCIVFAIVGTMAIKKSLAKEPKINTPHGTTIIRIK